MVGQQQYSLLREAFDQRQRVLVSLFGVDLEFVDDSARDNFAQRSGAVGGIHNRAGGGVKAEDARVLDQHHDHFATQHSRRDVAAWLDIFFAHSIKFHTSASG